jgi:UDP-glucose:(heptosyl)LPS alpha-1,3-glucosyltransferase
VIPNGVDGPRFDPAANAEAGARLRASLAPEAERVWLLVGSGFHRKGVDTALSALARSGRTRDVLLVAGSDPVEPWRARAAAAGIADRARFLGRRDDLPALYAACDALLLPTRYDAFANVCLEAAAAGRAVITSGSNGAAGWLGDGARVVADANDVDGFASALCELASDPQREAIAARAAARAAGASWEAHVEALHRLYQRIASR